MVKISTHPKITQLAKSYAQQIKRLKEEHESEIEHLYAQFRKEYQCLKAMIEAQEGEASANSLSHSSTDSLTPDRPSC